jgi:hypothetical protein
MKKNIVLVCAAVMLALCFSATNALAIKDQCIELNVMWDGDNETETMIVWLDSEGWFEAVSEGGFYGYWAQYGGSFVMQAISGCEPILAGTKKRGFHECTVGDFFVGDPTAAIPPEGFNTYTIKKINKKNCLEMMKIED